MFWGFNYSKLLLEQGGEGIYFLMQLDTAK